jgi:hypothetical protein
LEGFWLIVAYEGAKMSQILQSQNTQLASNILTTGNRVLQITEAAFEP